MARQSSKRNRSDAAHRREVKRLPVSILENALDFAQSAAEYVKSSKPRNLKYAILHLAAGIELLLKARLAGEHWTLIVSRVSDANRARLSTGDFISVNIETAWARLEEIAGLQFARNVFKDVDELRRLRNKIQHFDMSIDSNQALSLLAKGHNFVIDFAKNHMAKDYKRFEQQFDAIRGHLNRFEGFVAHRLETIKDALEAAKRKVDCPRCYQETLILDDDALKCAFCDYQSDYEELAREIGESDEVLMCPECGEIACTFVVFNNEDAGWKCIACGERGDYQVCGRCGQGLSKEDTGICAGCWDYMISKDD